MLTTLVFLPLVGSLILLLLPKDRHVWLRGIATAVSAVEVLISLLLLARFVPGQAGMQFVERASWIPSIGVQYYLGVDGVSLALVLVTSLVTLLATITSYSIQQQVKEFYALLLLLETGMLGVFVALDYVLFYVFWELVLVPMYFIIGIWGGPRRQYAALKFFLYTLAGSVIMLVGILALYFGTGLGTFDMLALQQAGPRLAGSLQWWIFLAFFLGFAVKVPIFPFHTWLPDAHVEAPTGGSMILAGVLLKMGAYGFYRIALPTLPQAAHQWMLPLATLGVISILYGALAAMAQKDLKKMVAYSSISHMGFVTLGLAALTPASISGAVFVMISHGLISPLMFFLVGTVFYERLHTRMLDELGGLFDLMPLAGVIFAFGIFANLGLPGLSGFIGEFFTLLGSFSTFQTLVIVSSLGLVLTAAYHLWMMQRVLMGRAEDLGGGHGPLADISRRELVVAVPLMILVLVLGVYPGPLLHLMNPAVLHLQNVVQVASRWGGM
ncbi:MAG: NADH-quinone oxidoreductase subunit M [Limnochordaceae bacterium]|nr:NADH-quinone oxidoreductase subunit M [Limnochordaceae bacterium]